jgi:exopolysaccharide biosynthesis polyprenyl glycosylphosphotransferase
MSPTVLSPYESLEGEARERAFELRSSVDERTRSLLGRRPAARRGWLVRRSLLAADLFGLSLAFLLARLLDPAQGAADRLNPLTELVVFFATLPCWVVVAKLHGLYDRDEEQADHSTTDDIVGVFHLVTLGAWVLVTASLLLGAADPGIGRVIAFWAMAIVLVTLARSLARNLCRRSAAFVQNTVIVGAGDVGQLLARKLMKHPEYGINVVGFVDRHPKPRRPDLPDHLAILGPPEHLNHIVRTLDIERVMVSFSLEGNGESLRMVRSLRELNVQIDIVPRLFEVVGPKVGVHTVEGLALVGLPPARLTPSSRILKRLLDIVVASAAIFATVPLWPYIAWRIKRDSPGPVFFRQKRLGYQMAEFTALKFRTMRIGTDASLHREYIRSTMSAGASVGANGLYKLDRGDAITPSGRWLRRTSLDELPQLINVLRGEMSLVGPRPCIAYEMEHFQPHHYERFLVPQGITGLWQVTARANSTFGEALDMDVAYVRGWSFGLDLRLLIRTPVQLLRQRASTT